MELESTLCALIARSANEIDEYFTVLVLQHTSDRFLEIIVKAVWVAKREVAVYDTCFYPIRFFKFIGELIRRAARSQLIDGCPDEIYTLECEYECVRRAPFLDLMLEVGGDGLVI